MSDETTDGMGRGAAQAGEPGVNRRGAFRGLAAAAATAAASVAAPVSAEAR
jgi:hypothetical protein